MDAQRMVRIIRQRGINDPRVLNAMEIVPRDKFVLNSNAAAHMAITRCPLGTSKQYRSPILLR